MKRNLFEQVLIAPNVLPAQSLTAAAGTAGKFDRLEYLSARLGVVVKTFAGTPGTRAFLALDIKHSDEESGTFTPVPDEMIGLTNKTQIPNEDKGITATTVTVEIGENGADGDGLYQVDLDMLGCKQFVQITPSAVGATFDIECALALGDKDTQEPV